MFRSMQYVQKDCLKVKVVCLNVFQLLNFLKLLSAILKLFAVMFETMLMF